MLVIIHLIRTQNNPKNLNFLPPDTHTRNVSFLNKIAFVINEWSLSAGDEVIDLTPDKIDWLPLKKTSSRTFYAIIASIQSNIQFFWWVITLKLLKLYGLTKNHRSKEDKQEHKMASVTDKNDFLNNNTI